MSQQVTHFRCLLISPSDVKAEREAVGRAIDRFNANSGSGLAAIVETVGWEIHTFPDLSGPAQEKINDQIVNTCDFGIAIFWSRVGTPTANHASGSVEEVEQLLAKGRKVLVYFCARNVPLDAQVQEIKRLRADYVARGLVASFESPQDLELAVVTALGTLVPKLMQEPTQQLPKPNIQVKATFGKIVEMARPKTAYPALQVSVQNHSSRPLYLASVQLEGKGVGTMQMLDTYGRPVEADCTIEPGNSFGRVLRMGGITTWPWLDVVAIDKIGRRFTPPAGSFVESLAAWNTWSSGKEISDWENFRAREGAYFIGVESIPGADK